MNLHDSRREVKRSKTMGGVFYTPRHRNYDAFNANCLAVPCPIELYAAWLAKWLEQDGKAYPQDERFADLSDWAAPTRSTSLFVPEGWADEALNFVVLSDMASVPGDPNAGTGKGQVLRLTYDRLRRLWATTTEPHKVSSYPDVEAYMFAYDQRTLLDRARRSLRDARRTIKASRRW